MISILVHTISRDENRNQLEKATFRSNFEKWFLQFIPESLENFNTEGTNSKKNPFYNPFYNYTRYFLGLGTVSIGPTRHAPNY